MPAPTNSSVAPGPCGLPSSTTNYSQSSSDCNLAPKSCQSRKPNRKYIVNGSGEQSNHWWSITQFKQTRVGPYPMLGVLELSIYTSDQTQVPYPVQRELLLHQLAKFLQRQLDINTTVDSLEDINCTQRPEWRVQQALATLYLCKDVTPHDMDLAWHH